MNKNRWTRFALLIGLSVFSLALLAACSDDDPEFEDDGTATATATATEATEGEGEGEGEGEAEGGEATAVAAELTEFAIELDTTSAPAGEVTFDANNTGALPHELIVIRSDEASGDLPVDGAQANLDGLDVVGTIDEFPAGETKSGTFELEAGNYILICNIAGHYPGGMHTSFTVE